MARPRYPDLALIRTEPDGRVYYGGVLIGQCEPRRHYNEGKDQHWTFRGPDGKGHLGMSLQGAAEIAATMYVRGELG